MEWSANTHRFIFCRKVRPRGELHRPDTEASQIAEVHLPNRVLQDERRVMDDEHIVGADSTLHSPTILPPGLPALQHHLKIIQAASTRIELTMSRLLNTVSDLPIRKA